MPMLGVITASTGTNVGTYYCAHWFQCWGVLVRPLTPMLGVIKASTDTNIEGYYWIHWHHCWVLLLRPLTPMVEVIIIATDTKARIIVLQLLQWALRYIEKKQQGQNFWLLRYSSLILNGLPNLKQCTSMHKNVLQLCNPLEVSGVGLEALYNFLGWPSLC